jgi:Cof subfamily protein (haloacid dehalogenase superfamily)|tara:strand:- start:278 stop:1105 length:828 start_codon:yes stop_codon:yes gene_type:complete
MQHQILAIDLDGTLLDGHVLQAPHRDAVRHAHDAGFKIIIATARWRQMAESIQKEIGCSDLIIACNGAQLFDPKTGLDLIDERLPADFAQALAGAISGLSGFSSATMDDETLIYSDQGPPHIEWPDALRRVDALPSFQRQMPRIMTVQGDEMVAAARLLLTSPRHQSILALDSIGPGGKIVMTFTAKAANKGHCLQQACAALNLTTESVIAFGDSEGDLDLFAAAGLSVAMGQASERVRAAADWVTHANTEHGIKTFLDRYFKGEIIGNQSTQSH